MENIIGHQNIISYLEKSAESGRLPHALIFSGPKNVGKTTVARWLSAKLLRTDEARLAIHPDFINLTPDGGISKEQIDEIIGKLQFTAFGGGHKVAIIEDAHLMTASAANAFLKTLEEPSKKTIIILLTPQLGKLLPTIVSRAAVLHFRPVAKDEIWKYLKDKNCADVKNITAIVYGRPGRAVNVLANPDEMNYAPKVEEFYKLFFGPTAERFAAVNLLLGKKADDNKEIMVRKIDFWLEIIRDVCFFKYSLPDNVVYAKQIGILEKMAKKKSADSLAALGVKLIKMRSLISNNINIKLMLENLII